MIYISIDIETTGLNPETCDIIEFAAVADDLSDPKPIETLPKFQTYLYQSNYKGEPKALAMHSDIFNKISNDKDVNLIDASGLMKTFTDWLKNSVFYNNRPGEGTKIVAAGKNFASFDKRFLDYHFKYKTPQQYYDYSLEFHHRTLDPMMLYLKSDDKEPPNMEECLTRAKLPQQSRKHDALSDAITVIELIRAYFYHKSI